ncbi:hypothetical protein FRA_48c14510 [Francisella sp. W12-1067]|nr:hypothetical protein FRA_48c14510 [Francisella sp. W12-1067]
MILFEKIDKLIESLPEGSEQHIRAVVFWVQLRDDVIYPFLSKAIESDQFQFEMNSKVILKLHALKEECGLDYKLCNDYTYKLATLIVNDFNSSKEPYTAEAFLTMEKDKFFYLYEAHIYDYGKITIPKFTCKDKVSVQIKKLEAKRRITESPKILKAGENQKYGDLFNLLQESHFSDIYFFKECIPVKSSKFDKYGPNMGYISCIQDGKTMIKPTSLENVLKDADTLLVLNHYDLDCDQETLLSTRAYIRRKCKVNRKVGIIEAKNFDYITTHLSYNKNITIRGLSLMGHCGMGNDLIWSSEQIIEFMKAFSTTRVHFIGCHTSNMDLTHNHNTMLQLFAVMQPMLKNSKIINQMPTIQTKFRDFGKSNSFNDLSLQKPDNQWNNINSNYRNTFNYLQQNEQNINNIKNRDVLNKVDTTISKTLSEQLKLSDFKDLDFKKSLHSHLTHSQNINIPEDQLCASEKLVIAMISNKLSGSVKGYTLQCNVHLNTGKPINTRQFLFKDYNKFDTQDELSKQKKQQFVKGFNKGFYNPNFNQENNFNPAKTTSRASTYVISKDGDTISAYSENPIKFETFPMCPSCYEFIESSNHECDII